MEWCDLPPGHAIGQAAASDVVHSWWARRVGRGDGVGHKTATPCRKPQKTTRNAGDRLNHPRYRDFAM